MNLATDLYRLYLNPEKVASFLLEAKEAQGKIISFAKTLVYIGCRISEALQITAKDIHRKEPQITLNSLKKKKRYYL
jgi:integrase